MASAAISMWTRARASYPAATSASALSRWKKCSRRPRATWSSPNSSNLNASQHSPVPSGRGFILWSRFLSEHGNPRAYATWRYPTSAIEYGEQPSSCGQPKDDSHDLQSETWSGSSFLPLTSLLRLPRDRAKLNLGQTSRNGRTVLVTRQGRGRASRDRRFRSSPVRLRPRHSGASLPIARPDLGEQGFPDAPAFRSHRGAAYCMDERKHLECPRELAARGVGARPG